MLTQAHIRMTAHGRQIFAVRTFVSLCLLMFLGFLPLTVSGQVELQFNDTAPILETGTALTQGARYRFRNVAPGTDARVTITSVVGGAVLVALDDNSIFPNRFQPIIRTTGVNITSSYIRFDVQLVAAGTTTARTVPAVFLSAQDVDGSSVANNIREWVEFSGTNVVTVGSPTTLVAGTAVAGGTRFNQSDAINAQNGIGTDNSFEAYTTLNNALSTFTIVGGNIIGSMACNAGDVVCDRLFSFAFDPGASNQTTPSADLVSTLTGPSPVGQGDDFAFTLTVTNNGPTSANGATVSVVLPAQFTRFGASCVSSGGAVCPSLTAETNVFVTTFPSGGQLLFTVNGEYGVTGTFNASGTITMPNGSTDTQPSNNTSSVTTQVAPIADLQIVKSQRAGTSGTFQTTTLAVNEGAVVQYQLVVTNAGGSAVSGAIFTDDVPSQFSGLSVVSAVGVSATVCSASFGTAPNQNLLTGSFSASSGGTCTVIIQGTTTSGGSVVNTGSVRPANNSSTGDPQCTGTAPPVCSGNNVSSVTTSITETFEIRGTIFEDTGYAGGAGRSLAASGGVPRGGARVELYNSSGTFLQFTTTATSGSVGTYSFTGLIAGTYTVRVVNSTVTSSRSGYLASLIGVQTFRTTNGSGDTARVGGEIPARIDSAQNSGSQTLAALTTASNTPQSIGTVSLTSTDALNVDFGFNFTTIVNVNDSGQGSLRQFILNANALNGADTTIFMISNGTARPGLAAGLPNLLTSGVAAINITSALPAISGAGTILDGTTQTTNVGNTNSGTLGTGGTVGVEAIALPTVDRPEVQLFDAATVAIGLDIQASGVQLRGFAIYGFGNGPDSSNDANVRVGAAGATAIVERNILGSTATSFTDPGSGQRGLGDNIRMVATSAITIRNNLIGFVAGKGIGAVDTLGCFIENNEIRGNSINHGVLDGIDLQGGGTFAIIVRFNLIVGHEGVGIDSHFAQGSLVIQNNTITGNGIGGTGETAGIRLFGSNNGVELNIINANFGAGILVYSNASSNFISRNSIFANGTITSRYGNPPSGQIGIDLVSSSDNGDRGTAPFVTLNDNGDVDSGANGLVNFPVIESVQIVNGDLVVRGFARPGATIEFFTAASDPSGFGEGQTFLFTAVEGSASDLDATSGTYASPLNGQTVGTDTTNRFRFQVPVPSGVAAGTVVTSTATVSSSTSEFGNNATVSVLGPIIGLSKLVSPSGTQLPGTDLTFTIDFANTGGQSANNFRLTDPDPANVAMRINSNMDFKLGTATASLATTGLTVTVSYSNDNGATFTYTPVSGGGGAPAGYDRNVTHIRWAFTGSLSSLAPNNAGSVSFVARIQ